MKVLLLALALILLTSCGKSVGIEGAKKKLIASSLCAGLVIENKNLKIKINNMVTVINTCQQQPGGGSHDD